MSGSLLNKTIVRYLIIGGAAFLLEMSCLYIAHTILGLSATIAVSISFWVGFVVAYLLQKLITFRNNETGRKALFTQVFAYSLLVGFNYGFTLLLVETFNDHVSVFVLRTIAIAMTTIWNYLVYSKIFKSKPVST